MPRYHVQDQYGNWNTYSTVIDDFRYPFFMPFELYKREIIKEYVEEREEELNTLMTDRPRLNTISYERAMELKRLAEQAQEDDLR